MFHHHVAPFGRFTRHTLANEAGTHAFTIIPELGAALQSLVFEGAEVIDGDQTPEEADFNKWSKGRLLFPFPNRLRDGAYEWGGQTYQFPCNDPDTGNALHGFGLDKTFEIEELSLSDSGAQMRCAYHYGGELPAYPFPFVFRVTYTMQANQFSLALSCLNTGEQAIPIGFGWHPYFQLADSVDAMSLQLPQLAWIGIDARMIPTGKRYDFDDFASLRPIAATVLDNCFGVLETGPELSVQLQGSRGKLRYWQELGPGKFPYIQLFTPPHRRSLAIEPMSCNIDAFHNHEGLLSLAAGQETSARCGVDFTALD